jgi:hypothetical protein
MKTYHYNETGQGIGYTEFYSLFDTLCGMTLWSVVLVIASPFICVALGLLSVWLNQGLVRHF